ncbi:unnamed protein product, partial [Cylicostephanus goldi]
ESSIPYRKHLLISSPGARSAEKKFQQGVSDNVRLLLQGLICKKVRKYLDEDLNQKLAEVQTRSPLTEAIEANAIRSTRLTSGSGGITLGSIMGKSFSKDFYIDFRLREDPHCSLNTVDLACAGEISYKGEGGTPFGPPPIQWLNPQTDSHMIMLQISDYLPNSLFYHAHKFVDRNIQIISLTKKKIHYCKVPERFLI